jgi:hypothetical protein
VMALSLGKVLFAEILQVRKCETELYKFRFVSNVIVPLLFERLFDMN